MYTAELRARNLKVPDDRVVDAVVEYIITGNRLPALRELGDILLETGKGIRDMSSPRGRHASGRAPGPDGSE